ncbi:MAG TPA: hypothetical protein VNZ03_27460 [Terriglobales bacterium]|jgi:hypothetical protein|nr:hypothetical protein [Terriglobales bacterium]
MNTEVNPPILCHICGEPVSLTSDTVADEDGKSVHEGCYVARVLPSEMGQEEAH